MCRFGSLVSKGVPLALHSDCTMAPLEPLRLAWAAASRQTLAGMRPWGTVFEGIVAPIYS
jgi:predicted amidohydrolase YtcJ